MASSVGIANKALTLLGALPITAFTDDSPAARAVNRIYDETRRELLAAHPWNFAIKRASLAASATAPTHTYARAFPLPSDCLRVREALAGDYLYGIEGEQIVTDATAPLSIVYIADIEDPNQMSPQFREALSYRLAAQLAFQITGNATLSANMEVIAGRKESLARSYDAQEGEYYEQDEGTWLESRY